MAYKFQLGSARLSGSTVFEDALETKKSFTATSLSASAAVSGNTLDIGTHADIDGDLDLGGKLKMADNTSGKILVADGTSYEEVVMSGDVAIASGGATTIQADAVEQSMIADDAVGAAQLASDAVVNASIASGAAIDMDKLDGGSLAASLSDLAQGDLLYAGDVDASNALKSITFSDFEDAIFGNVSGDALIAAGGALTIQAQAVENSMLADDAVGADELASNAVVNASVVDGALKADKLDLDGSTDIGADLADADLLIVDDGAGGTNRVAALSRMKKYVYSAMSGDATASDAGALTIAAGAVEGSMLNSNVVADTLQLSGSALRLSSSVAGAGIAFSSGVLSFDMDEFAALGGTGVAQGDHFIFSDDGTEKRITFSNLEDAIFGNVSGDATIAAGGALTIAAQAVENSMLADDAVGADELASNAVVNASVVDGALKADKLDIDGSTDIGADLVDADLLVVDDGATGTNRKSELGRVKKYIYSAMSGDATASDSGQLTISADSVEGTMLNTNSADGSTLELSDNNLSVIKVPNALTQGDGITAFSYDGSGALTVALSASVAGTGLSYSSGVISSPNSNVSAKDFSGAVSLSVGYNVPDGTSMAGAIAATMPAPVLGAKVTVKAPGDCSSTNTVTIGGATMDGVTSLVLEGPGAAVTLICNDSGSDSWVIV